MSYLLSVDPGLRWCGVALWRGRDLFGAALVRSHCDSADISVAAEAMVGAILQWQPGRDGEDLRPYNLAPGASDLECVCELMRTYGGRARKGDANDLIAVAVVSGVLKGRLRVPTRLVEPAPITKGVTKARAQEDLSPVELSLVELPRGAKAAENVWDAVGVGLRDLKTRGLRR